MNVRTDNLVLEITRRCNMLCPHCMRGAARRLDMTKEIMNRVLDQFDYISAVTFTGGEPSLAIPMIQHFIEEVA